MCKYFVEWYERSTPSKTGLPVYLFIVNEIAPKEFPDMIRESSAMISYEFMNYNKKFLVGECLKEVFLAIKEVDSGVQGGEVALGEMCMEINSKTYKELSEVCRWRFEYEEGVTNE